MKKKTIISVDIGSTYTKAGRFEWNADKLSLSATRSVPTDVDLCLTVDCLLNALASREDVNAIRNDFELFFSSSAKGGLSMVAIGVVPDLTLDAAKQVAYSAGAKVSNVFAYKLTKADIAAITGSRPDIILLCGGTDGGCEDYNLHNAKMLAQSALECPIIYAGNRVIQDDIRSILIHKECHIADNILPEINKIEGEPVRDLIRGIFLENIVKGKGLDQLINKYEKAPLPTPCAMFEFIKAIHRTRPDFGDFCVVDIGGATTDFYSCGGAQDIVAGAIYKGRPEPGIKRTVEGDLGLRVSLDSVVGNYRSIIEECFEKGEYHLIDQFVDRIKADCSCNPCNDMEQNLDGLLAGICFAAAMIRHAGYTEDYYSSQGHGLVQYGKNLSALTSIICTGGFFAWRDDFQPMNIVAKIASRQKVKPLIPEQLWLRRDDRYLWGFLANIAQAYPDAAANAVGSFFSKE